MKVGPKQKIERSSFNREQQAQGWGWPGIDPTLSTYSRLKTTYAKGQLKKQYKSLEIVWRFKIWM